MCERYNEYFVRVSTKENTRIECSPPTKSAAILVVHCGVLTAPNINAIWVIYLFDLLLYLELGPAFKREVLQEKNVSLNRQVGGRASMSPSLVLTKFSPHVRIVDAVSRNADVVAEWR